MRKQMYEKNEHERTEATKRGRKTEVDKKQDEGRPKPRHERTEPKEKPQISNPKKRLKKTYNNWCSLVVTDPTTLQSICGL